MTSLQKTVAMRRTKNFSSKETTGQIRFRGATPTKRVQKERKLYGGTTVPTKFKLAKRLETLLAAKFAMPKMLASRPSTNTSLGTLRTTRPSSTTTLLEPPLSSFAKTTKSGSFPYSRMYFTALKPPGPFRSV
jgi:hypothetical protein